MTQSAEKSDEGSGSDEPQTGVEKRINQLTKQRHEATRRADTAQEQNTALTDQLIALQGTVQDLTTQLAKPGQPAVADPLATLLGTGPKPAKTEQAPVVAPPVDIAKQIQDAVKSALAPMFDKQTQDSAANELQIVQRQSFEEAAEMVPDIRVSGSPAQDLFDKMWSGNPELQLSPNGPGIVIAAVAGLLGSGSVRDTTKLQDARKQAASSPNPMNALARLSDLPDGKVTKEQAIASLADEGARKGLDKDGMAAYIGLQIGRAKISEE